MRDHAERRKLSHRRLAAWIATAAATAVGSGDWLGGVCDLISVYRFLAEAVACPASNHKAKAKCPSLLKEAYQ